MKPGQVFSHVTACRLLGIPVPSRLIDDRIDVADFLPAALPRGRGVRGHRLSPRGIQLTTVGGLPVVAAEVAWCQLAALASQRELVVAGDGLLRRHAPLATPERVALAVEQRAGRRGHRALVRAAHEIRAGTDSPQETLLRLDLVAAGLPEPEVNPRILDADGGFLGIGDLAYARWRVLVEYDGEQHRTDDGQFARDLDRLDDFARAGWRVIRFTKQHRGERRARQIERVREALVLAGWRSDA
ncbi:DUF559 domain-containing protein [Agromyces mediolanus]|uniref:endonuclease domain-containing protein n=1 Tax=Agromyces mediolanus TaxID=41986 RepID=UPI0038358561